MAMSLAHRPLSHSVPGFAFHAPDDAYTLMQDLHATRRAQCRWAKGPPHPSMGFGDAAIAAGADEVLTTSTPGISDAGGKF